MRDLRLLLLYEFGPLKGVSDCCPANNALVRRAFTKHAFMMYTTMTIIVHSVLATTGPVKTLQNSRTQANRKEAGSIVRAVHRPDTWKHIV